MTKDDHFGIRIRLMKIDVLTEDIHRIVSEVPSSYEIPKKYLSEARSCIRVDPSKALKLIKKAHKGIREESVVATGYNRIRERVRFSDDKAISKYESKYLEFIAKGNYKAAQKLVKKMTDSTTGLGHPVSVSFVSKDDDGASLRVSNSSERTIVVILVRGGSGTESLVFEPASFSIAPFSDRLVKCTGELSTTVNLVVEYRDGDMERSVVAPISIS